MSKFSQRHYIVIAEVLKEQRQFIINDAVTQDEQSIRLHDFDLLYFKIKLMFDTDNDRFNSNRFHIAVYEY